MLAIGLDCAEFDLSEFKPCSALWLMVCCRPTAESSILLARVCDGAVGASAPTAVNSGATVVSEIS